MSKQRVLGAFVGAPLAAVAAWILYSALLVDHRRHLPPALPGRRRMIETPAGTVSLYQSADAQGDPLLLVHSINAAASAFEMRPLFLHYRGKRPVYAIDLPGYGLSERRNHTYTPADMTNAIHVAAEIIQRDHTGSKVDVIALSTSCEYVARAAIERVDLYRSLGLISPVGFDKAPSGEGPSRSTKGSALKLAAVSGPWRQALYDLVVSAPSMRFFLEKTFGSKEIDEELFAYDQLTAQQPNARHAVWSFLAGFLFADDASRLYRELTLPVWTCHGKHGDFIDFRKEVQVADRQNWTFVEFETGAMPQFQDLQGVVRSYDEFAMRLLRAFVFKEQPSHFEFGFARHHEHRLTTPRSS